MSKPLRIAFAGTPDFAARHLGALLEGPHEVVCVYTQPDRPAGRGRKLTPSPVKVLALEHGLSVHQPQTLKSSESRAALIEAQIDVLVVVAYGLILPREVLEIAPLGAINVHASLLPRWRGAAPIQRAIEAGDRESGITLMAMDEGLDTGDMLHVVRTPIDEQTSAALLHDRLEALGPPALTATLAALSAGTATPTPQPVEGVTYAKKLSKAEAELDFHQSARVLARRVRAFNPFPVAWTRLGRENLRIWEAEPHPVVDDERSAAPGTLLKATPDAIRVACGDGALHITRAQLPGSKPMPAGELSNRSGSKLAPGIRLGVTPSDAPSGETR